MPITIKVNKNGPYVIADADMAEVTIVDHEGNVIPTTGKKRISLCRCGASTTKPFCDGTHSRIGFIGAEVAREEFDKAGAGGAGTPGAAASGAAAPSAAAPAAPAPGTPTADDRGA